MRVPKDEICKRINKNSPSAGFLGAIVDDIYKTLDASVEERGQITSDKTLSAFGKQSTSEAKTKARIFDLCNTAKMYRSARAQFIGQRHHLGKPDFDKTDLASALERQEIRTAIRNAPQSQKMILANQFFEAGQAHAIAFLSGPPTGLHSEMLKELHQRYLKTYFAEDMAKIEAGERDLEPVGAAVDAGHAELFAASGMTETQYQSLVRSYEDEIDGRKSA